MEWYIIAMQRYADFAGRARRKEYWFFTLFNTLITMAIAVCLGFVGERVGFFMVLFALYVFATIVPTVAVGVRRLHDVGRRGWWLLLGAIPFGGLVLLYWCLKDRQPGTNEYGPNPKGILA